MLPRPKKRLGQHFLTDRHYLDRIVAEIDPQPGEADAWRSARARARSRSGWHSPSGPCTWSRSTANWPRRLRARFAPDAVVVHEGDALDFDFASLPADLRVVGNLPYNVSTPLLFHVAAFAPRIRDCVFMLQKEVVERMVAEPGTPDVRPALGDAAVPLRDGARLPRAARRLHAAAEGGLGRRAHGAARRGQARARATTRSSRAS